MKKLIVNADDFGFNENINRGIVEAYKNGIVTTTSMMVTKEGFEDAVRLSRENSGLEIGVHLDLDNFFNIDHVSGVLLDRNVDVSKLKDIENEIIRQIEIFKCNNIPITHLSSHHNVHLVEKVFEIVCSIANSYGIKIIRFFRKFYSSEEEFLKMRDIIEKNSLLYPRHFIEGWYWGNVDEDYTIAELITHPGYGELWREYELSVCKDINLKRYLESKNIYLINFSRFLKDQLFL